jgi:hypothetical protein
LREPHTVDRRGPRKILVSNKNSARPNALETLHSAIENHRLVLEEAFGERGPIWLLPAPVREAITDILKRSALCRTAAQ